MFRPMYPRTITIHKYAYRDDRARAILKRLHKRGKIARLMVGSKEIKYELDREAWQEFITRINQRN